MVKRKERPLLERVADDGSSKFARALGSVDYHTREKGLQALTLWLSRRTDIEQLELLKLWKGLFYCYWHSDKLPVQTALAERLSELLLHIPEQVALLYYSVFITTLRREWFGIDHLRLDKFLMLIRKFFHQALRLLQSGGWGPDAVQHVTSLWQAILLPTDNVAAAGLAYHMCDVFLPELAAVSSSAAPPSPAALRTLLDPFCHALCQTHNPAMVLRLRHNNDADQRGGVFDPLLDQLGSRPPPSPWDCLDSAGLAAHMLELGARQDTRAKNREALYAISTALERVGRRQQELRARPAAEGVPAQQQQQGKKKKKKRREAEAVLPNLVVVKEVGPEDQGDAALAEEQGGSGDGMIKPKKTKTKGTAVSVAELPAQQQAAGAAGDGQCATPAAPRQVVMVEGGTNGKKNVRFALRRNLVMTIGQPPLPEDVRTPPTSRPKGSALKAGAPAPSTAPGRLSGGNPEKGSTRGKSKLGRKGSASVGKSTGGVQQANGHKARRKLQLPSPHTLPRPKAAEFF